MMELKQTDHDQLRVPRRATAQRAGASPDTRFLADWRGMNAYVLLGDPGSGKSCSFEAEAKACNGILVVARDIVDRVASAPVGDSIVFIDALDEVRAGAGDGKAPLGAIRRWLHEAGNPRFRLSCREADWLGESDRNALQRVAPGQQLEVLHLEPLQQGEVFAVLRGRSTEVPDPEAFWQQAERFGLIELFGNPLLLDLTIKAVTQGGANWPSTRQGIYEAACRQLATETSTEHLALKPPKPGDVDRLLNDAGLLCAVLLLSNKLSWSLQPGSAPDRVELASLPDAFPLRDAHAALASKVFTAVAGQSTPRHRSIAEFLAAKALAKRIDEGLPLGRLLALMQGFDGRPVDPLRGLFAWLAVHHARDRGRLIELDPLGVVLNGDVAAFGTSERLGLLEALNKLAQSNPWFRQNAWVSHPFGPLATADMAATYERLLRAPERTDAHQAFIDCVLDALSHGERMPALGPALEAWVEDPSASEGNRLSAYQAWKHDADAKSQTARQLDWLEQAFAGTVPDVDDQLTGALLTDLYPDPLGPREVLRFLRPAKRSNLIAEYSTFWRHNLLYQSRPHDFAALADAWAEIKSTPPGEARDFDKWHLSGEVLAAALAHADDNLSNERLFAWLGIGLDEHGSSKLEHDSKREVAQWLEAHPERMKAVLALGYESTLPNAQDRRFFWQAEERLHGARRPRDWLRWLLDTAAATQDDELAEYCFRQVAPTVLDQPSSLDVPTMEEIERWVETHASTRPAVRQWLAQAWSSNLDEWQGEHHRDQLKYKAQQMQAREERKRALQPYLPALASGSAPVNLLHQMALAHDKRFTDMRGETPVERVQDFLVSDAATAQAALAGIDQVLKRKDLPSVDEIFATDAKGKYPIVRPPALLAAARAVERAPNAPLAWTDDLAQKLVAFYLTDGTGNMPAWYRQLAAQLPGLVAPILSRYAAPKLRLKGAAAITGLWALSREADHRELARLVLPELLSKFPTRASEASRRELNRSLLAAMYLLEDAQAARIVELKLAQPGLDPMQRISWLVATLPHRAEAADELAQWVGNNERRGVALGLALHEQGSLGRSVQRMSPASVQRLIEILAPITPRKIDSQGGFVTVADNREDTVRGLISALSSNPDAEARDVLRALKESDRLGAWKAYLDYSAGTQQSVAREALFQVADPVAVALTIANRAPANAFDLQALVIDHLSDMEAELRGANTHLVRQFWQDATEGRVPYDENFCRDLLLSKLQDRLNFLNIHIEREASAAQDKRADIRAEFRFSGKHISLPIEVKKENHDRLWTAWRDQLLHLYTIDPAAGGCGLYLVLWFGRHPRSTPEGVKPSNAQEMRELIVARIPPVERHRLAVQVLDLSLPAT